MYITKEWKKVIRSGIGILNAEMLYGDKKGIVANNIRNQFDYSCNGEIEII